MLPSYAIRLLVAASLLVGCRSEKVAFQFRPPAASPHRLLPAPPDTLAAPPVVGAVAKPPRQPSPPLAQAARRSLLRPPLKQTRQLVAQLSRPLARYLKRPLREPAAVQVLPKTVRFGLVLMGLAVLFMVVVLLAAPSVVTFEGAILAYVGYLLALGTFIAGAITAVLGLLLAKS